MSPRAKPLELSTVRAQLTRIVPQMRTLLDLFMRGLPTLQSLAVLLEDMAADLHADIDATPAPRTDGPRLVQVRPRHPTAVTHVHSESDKREREHGERERVSPSQVADARSRLVPPEPLAPTSTPLGPMKKGERRLLIAIAQQGNAGADRTLLRLLTGYSARSLTTYQPRLRTRGFVTKDGSRDVVTPSGIAALGTDFVKLPTGAKLRAYWLGKLPAGESRILGLIVGHPSGLTRAEIRESTKYSERSLSTYLPRLARRRLIVNDGASIRASDSLFDKGER